MQVAADRAVVDGARPTGRPGPTVDGVTGALVGVLSFLIAVRPALDNDLWFHLRTADWMLEHHRWVGLDPFTHTRPGVARVQTDWLGQLTLHGAWRVAGLVGIALVVAAVLAAAMVVLYRGLTGPVRVRAGVVLLTAAASSIFWSARTQTFTFLGTVVVVSLLGRWRRAGGGPLVWWLVPLGLVWVNTHGGVVYGVLLLVAALAGEWANSRLPERWRGVAPLPRTERRRLTLVTAAVLTVLVVNPSGGRVYGLPFDQVASSAAYVQEVQPPSITDPTALPFFALAALAFGLLVARRRSLDVVEVLWVVGAAVFAFRFTRSIPFFAVAAAPVVARHLAAVLPDRDPAWRRDAPAPGGLLGVLGVAVVATLALTAVRLDPDRVEERRRAEYPVDAVAWIEANQPPHELFNTFDWGGFLMWELPGYGVSVDGRTDLYDGFLDTYHDVIRARPGWEEELAREGIGTVLVDRGAPLATALAEDGDWAVAHQDPVAVVFIRP